MKRGNPLRTHYYIYEVWLQRRVSLPYFSERQCMVDVVRLNNDHPTTTYLVEKVFNGGSYFVRKNKVFEAKANHISHTNRQFIEGALTEHE